ncbi:MAG: DUF192 domain-containing protein [Planctomycetota bacterium]
MNRPPVPIGGLALALLVLATLIGCGGSTRPPVDEGPRVEPAPTFPTDPPGDGRFFARIGGELVRLEVAAVPEARARGLAGRTALAPDEGMIFVYPEAASRSFWMKGCLISLDIAYLDDERRIFQLGSLDPGAPDAADHPRLVSTGPARYVVEMEKGWFARHGLGVGEIVRFSPELEEWVALVRDAEGR